MLRACALGLVAMASVGACAPQIRESWAVQPNPIAGRASPDVSLASVPLYVYQRHMFLRGNWLLRHAAQFVAVARDRVRFHVLFASPVDIDLDVRDLGVWLEDDAGRRLHYESIELPRVKRRLAGIY